MLTVNGSYSDENGNTIEAPSALHNVQVEFKGKNNKLIITPNSKINNSKIFFPSDNGVCLVGDCWYKGALRIGYDCLIILGARVSCTNPSPIFTAERSFAIIGDDAMIGSSTNIRGEDSHAIYDVESGDRSNPSRNIILGAHVWVADHVTILSNTTIGAGSVVGTRSLIKGKFPNNSLIVGLPAKAVKKNIAWERPHVVFNEPTIKSNAIQQNLILNKNYWHKTDSNNNKVAIGRSAFYLLNKYQALYPQFEFPNILEEVEYTPDPTPSLEKSSFAKELKKTIKKLLKGKLGRVIN